MTKKTGRPTYHGTRKKTHGVSLTDEAWAALQQLARNQNVSVSEYLEALSRRCLNSEGG